jgi:hypothetical protein
MLVHGGRPVGVSDRSAVRAFEPGPVARLAARVRSRSLDSALAGGADPAATPQLAARAARLTARPTRLQIARALERLARTERQPDGRWRVLPFTAAIRANAPELRALAAVLRGPAPVYARGVAMLRLLVTDGTGPAYSDREGGALAMQLRDARAAISGLVGSAGEATRDGAIHP